jgi:hypothetical protein
MTEGYETHTNEEPIRKCPYCEWEGASRGLTFHVLNSSDDDHGEKYDLPDDFEASEAKIVGYEDVEVEMPDEYNIDERLMYVCDYCGKICRGKGGLRVHLSHSEGDGVHQEGAADRDPETFPTFKVNENGQLIPQDDDAEAVVSGGAIGVDRQSLERQEAIPIEAVKQLRDDLVEINQGGQLSSAKASQMVNDLIEEYQ